MIDESKQCETCPWPLECCPEERPAKPAPACPRETGVWAREMRGGRFEMPTTRLDVLAAPDRELVLV
jgi:hypothetical protein